MTDAVPLDADGMSALLGEIAGSQPVDAAIGQAAARAAEVRPFALGRDSFRPAERLTGLERMGEKLARALKPAVESFAHARLTVDPLPIETAAFGRWIEDLPPFVSLSHYRLRPLKNGAMLVAVNADLVAGLVEAFYGGRGLVRPHRGGDFTASEGLLLGRLLERVVGLLMTHWREVAPIEAQLLQRETGIQHIGFLRDDDPVALQRFEIACGGERSCISVAYPLAMLRPIEERMARKVHGDGEDADGAWRGRMAAALAEVSLPVRSVLARPEISVAGLLALKPGDVIPITIAQRTPLLAASRRIAEGMIGEQEGRAALMIEKVGPEA